MVVYVPQYDPMAHTGTIGSLLRQVSLPGPLPGRSWNHLFGLGFGWGLIDIKQGPTS